MNPKQGRVEKRIESSCIISDLGSNHDGFFMQ